MNTVCFFQNLGFVRELPLRDGGQVLPENVFGELEARGVTINPGFKELVLPQGKAHEKMRVSGFKLDEENHVTLARALQDVGYFGDAEAVFDDMVQVSAGHVHGVHVWLFEGRDGPVLAQLRPHPSIRGLLLDAYLIGDTQFLPRGATLYNACLPAAA